ncbi:unnamed protein product, partial [Discosporangium mesarthrocarpum]
MPNGGLSLVPLPLVIEEKKLSLPYLIAQQTTQEQVFLVGCCKRVGFSFFLYAPMGSVCVCVCVYCTLPQAGLPAPLDPIKAHVARKLLNFIGDCRPAYADPFPRASHLNPFVGHRWSLVLNASKQWG